MPQDLDPEPGRKQVLSVKNWAEIRRLRRAEQVPIADSVRKLTVANIADMAPQQAVGSHVA